MNFKNLPRKRGIGRNKSLIINLVLVKRNKANGPMLFVTAFIFSYHVHAHWKTLVLQWCYGLLLCFFKCFCIRLCFMNTNAEGERYISSKAMPKGQKFVS
jgi:hypothetical protein